MSAGTAAPHLTLELAVAPEAAGRLLHHPALVERRLGRARSTATTVTVHDTADGALAEAGLALLVEPRGRGAVQRLVRILPDAANPAEPTRPPALVAETRIAGAPDPAALAGLLPGAAEAALRPIAAAAGRRGTLRLAGDLEVALFAGVLRGGTAGRPFARLWISAPEARAAEALALAATLAADLPVAVPATALAEEARALALGTPARPFWRGPPDLAGATTVEDGARRAIAQLTLALVAAAPVAAEGTDPEGVHQMRVAIRRLRTALTVFRAAIGCPATAALKDRLGELARRLGPARDWDVLIAGTLAEVAAAFPQAPALARLRRAAVRARAAAYAEVRAALEAPAFRLLTLELAAAVVAPPWREATDAEAEALRSAPLEAFAASALARRHRRLMRAGAGFAGLDIPALHALRIEAKRLRYAGELLGGLFGRKRRRRFQKALARLQDALGHLNDTAVAAGLMQALGGRGGSTWAAGVVQGWVAARAAPAREDAARAWHRLAERAPFWQA